MSTLIRTDLALENREIYLKAKKIDESISGVEIQEDSSQKNLLITKVVISSKEGSKALGKPVGTYITLESKLMNSEMEEIDSLIIHSLSNSLKELSHLASKDSVLVVGLGNNNVTPDALGPKVIENLQITRHLLAYTPEFIPQGTRAVSAIVPGVLGTTGIETSEIVKGIVDKIHPNLVLVVDALASKSLDRISNTIQISNVGITPGSGVGNRRFAITQKELQVPVIVIGVPTVVGIPTIVEEAISNLCKDNSAEIASMTTEECMKAILQKHEFDCMVTPKDIDDIVNNLSHILAEGINHALN